jgi:hypothetical protein
LRREETQQLLGFAHDVASLVRAQPPTRLKDKR